MSNYSNSQFNFDDPNSSWAMTFKRIPKNSTVLDIGCSSGNFAKELIDQKKCIVDGIEIDVKDAEEARKKLRNVYVLNIETDVLPEEKYDVIFMGDVIEHLSRPIPTLSRLSSLLNPDGIIVFSIPNITHMLVRLMLLKGEITYGKTGLLDETHLHFYNESEIFRVFNQASYSIDDIEYVKRDIPIETIEKELKQIGLTANNSFTELAQSTDAATYQFVGVAKNSKSVAKPKELPVKSPININDEYLINLHKQHETDINDFKLRMEKLTQRNEELQVELDGIKRRKHELHVNYQDVVNSKSYRIGRVATAPIRLTKKSKFYLKKSYAKTKNNRKIKSLISNTYGIKFSSPMKAPDISLVIRSIDHPTSSTFIRLLPLIAKLNMTVELVDGDRPVISKKSRIVIIQRTAIAYLDDAKKIISQVKTEDKKLFVDTDDAFGELDKNHSQYNLQRERVDALDYVIENADEIWFSTDTLRQLYNVDNPKVVQNTLYDKVWSRLQYEQIKAPKPGQPLRIVYMGTVTHSSDFEMILPTLERLNEKYPGKFELSVIGVAKGIEEYPWLKVRKPNSALYPEFIKWFNSLEQFDIGLSPLEDSAFNKNKSDIKCLDYLACGIRPVVSNVTAYENPQLDELITRVDNNEDAWFKALESEIINLDTNRKSMKKNARKGFQYIKKERSTEKAAELIKQSIFDKQ